MTAPPAPGAPPRPELIPGSLVGKYQIIRRLNSGGMAELYVGRLVGLPGFEKPVVIKCIRPELASQAHFVEMFLDEARVSSTLHHPNIVQTYDIGVADGVYYIAMECLHGEDVRSVMRTLASRGARLPLQHALQIAIGVAAGLHYAHDKTDFDGEPLRIVHRDVTPQNVMVTFEGGVKLLDFGIAKAEKRFGETQTGTLKGKLGYMSPEQCRGESLDRRADVFALGIMLWELTTGRRLFRAQNDYEVMRRIVDDPVTAPSDMVSDYPRELETVVMRALAKDRALRYQSARELQMALEGVSRSLGQFPSTLELQQFMEQVFGKRLEAWREALARGMSLEEHLATEHADGPQLVEVDEDDLEEIPEDEASQVERRARDRAQLIAMLEAQDRMHKSGPMPIAWRTTPSGPMAAVPVVALPSSSGSMPIVTPVPTRRLATMIALIAVGCTVLGGGGVWWVLARRARLQHATAPSVAAIPTRPAPKPPEPVGIVKLTTNPPAATLFLDGRKLDKTSPTMLDGIAAGREHVLLVQLDGYDDQIARFTVQPSDVLPLEVTLTRPAPPPSPMPTAPPTPHTSSKKTPHGDAVATSKPSETKPVTPPPPAAVPTEGEGALVIETTPWCDISVDGVERGQSPARIKLKAGPHEVLLTNPDFKIKRSLSVVIPPNDTVRKRLDFEVPQ